MILRTFAAAVVAAAATASSAAAASQPATPAVAARTQLTHIVVWSVNSDGPDFRAILTGTVGDFGPAVTVHPDGTVDPEHASELELKLSRGSFRLSIAELSSDFAHAVTHWPYDRATCSIHGTVSGTAPIVTGSGTGAYKSIAGAFALTLSLDEDWVRGPACSETTGFAAQLLQLEGSGTVRV